MHRVLVLQRSVCRSFFLQLGSIVEESGGNSHADVGGHIIFEDRKFLVRVVDFNALAQLDKLVFDISRSLH